MKKVFLPLIVVCLLFGTSIAQLVKTVPPTDYIPDEKSKHIISKLLKNDNLFALIGKGQGGIFEADKFKLTTGNEGIMLWFCYDPASNKLFVALEQIGKYDVKKLPDLPQTDNLIVPYTFSHFKKGDSIEDDDILKYLRSDSEKPVDELNPQKPYKFGTLTNDQAKFYVQQFKEWQGKIKSTYCEYSFSCFGEGKAPGDPSGYFLTNLTTPKNGYEVAYVRYYFAYDEDKDTNKIRLLLMATDKDGNRLSLARPDGGGLESSWPPPPPPSKKK